LRTSFSWNKFIGLCCECVVPLTKSEERVMCAKYKKYSLLLSSEKRKKNEKIPAQRFSLKMS